MLMTRHAAPRGNVIVARCIFPATDTPVATLRPHPELCCGVAIFNWTEVVHEVTRPYVETQVCKSKTVVWIGNAREPHAQSGTARAAHSRPCACRGGLLEDHTTPLRQELRLQTSHAARKRYPTAGSAAVRPEHAAHGQRAEGFAAVHQVYPVAAASECEKLRAGAQPRLCPAQ